MENGGLNDEQSSWLKSHKSSPWSIGLNGKRGARLWLYRRSLFSMVVHSWCRLLAFVNVYNCSLQIINYNYLYYLGLWVGDRSLTLKCINFTTKTKCKVLLVIITTTRCERSSHCAIGTERIRTLFADFVRLVLVVRSSY